MGSSPVRYHDLSSLGLKPRMRRTGHVTHIREMTNVYNSSGGKSEKKLSLEKPKHRWK
jgi:hypothetical protein